MNRDDTGSGKRVPVDEGFTGSLLPLVMNSSGEWTC
jgi:hypothetical protein